MVPSYTSATTMATTTQMPGNWPLETPLQIDPMHELFLPISPISPMSPMSPISLLSPPYPAERKQQAPVPTSRSTSKRAKSAVDMALATKSHYGAPSSSYLAFEPVVESVSEHKTVDWKRYEPPQELLNHPDDTSEDIRRLIQASIDALQARHLEEERGREAAARNAKPLGRSRRVSGRPKVEVAMSRGLDPLQYSQENRSSIGSASSLQSNDSGYGSRTDSTGNSAGTSSKSEKTFLSGLSSRFKHQRTSLSPFGKLGEMTNILTLTKLDRSAPEAPATESSGISLPSNSMTSECVSCLDDFPPAKVVQLSCHSYCKECFQRLINNALESETHWPVKCCLTPIPYKTIKPHLDTKTLKTYQARQAEWSIPASSRIYCSSSKCSTFIPPQPSSSKNQSTTCPKCPQKTCLICRGASHPNSECPQDPALLATIQLAELSGWKRCYSCHALVEHNQGCRHMTCRCTAQFCYICSARWRTCACTDAQLETVQVGVRQRRLRETMREGRQREIDEEEARNVRAVEEFIAGEEAAAEARLVEEEEVRRREEEVRRREEEERRRREEEMRRQEEEARRESLRNKYHGLEIELAELHEYQRTQVHSRHESEGRNLAQQYDSRLSSLSTLHSREVENLTLESKFKIEDWEQHFETEYTSRLVEEQRVEEQYLSELQDYWKGAKDEAYKIRESMDSLREEQQKGFREWNAWRKNQIKTLGESHRRSLDWLEGKQRSEAREVQGQWDIDIIEEGRMCDADSRWVDAVVSERIAILRSLEAEELGDGQIGVAVAL